MLYIYLMRFFIFNKFFFLPLFFFLVVFSLSFKSDPLIILKADLVSMNPLIFACLRSFSSLLILNDSFAEQSILGCKFFPFSTLNKSCHSPLPCKISVEKPVGSLWGVSLVHNSDFLLLTLKLSL